MKIRPVGFEFCQADIQTDGEIRWTEEWADRDDEVT